MAAKATDTPLTPGQAATLTRFLSDPVLRLSSLYWIVDKDGQRRRFHMNWAQQELHEGAHTRNNILKVRQLGISTYVAILILDSCLFTPNFKAGIIDKTLKDAQAKLDKITFAFDSLDFLPESPSPEDAELATIGRMLKAHHAGLRSNQQTVSFPNGSEVTVGTSLRGGTLQLLHVSELGSIAAHDPMRATEIISGSLNTVGKNCRIFMESTHEGGKYGINYEQILAAMDNVGKPLSPLDFKFFFFPWFRHPEYVLDCDAHPTAEQLRYFSTIEQACGVTLSSGQRAWYAAMERVQMSRMKQEYPSTPDEALNPITDGTIYSSQIMSLRERGHLKAAFEPDPHRPIYTAWDFGIGDYMSVWWVQPDGRGRWLLLANYTAHQQPLAHYIGVLREYDARWGRCAGCIVPHDGAKRDINLVPQDAGLAAAGYSVTRVPRTQNLWASVDHTREFLHTCIFHEGCSEPTLCEGVSYISGVDALMNYRLAPPGAHGNLARQPLHDMSSHAADALRCFADAVKLGLVSPVRVGKEPKREPRKRSSYVERMLS